MFEDPIRGPKPLVVALPLLMAVPLLWRRHRPLLVWCLGGAGIVAQALASQHSAEGLETLAVLFVGSYSVAAYADRRGALIGLVVLVVTYGVFAYIAHRVRDRHFAEDLTAEVFSEALAGIGKFEWRGAPFGAWLLRIASRAVADLGSAVDASPASLLLKRAGRKRTKSSVAPCFSSW